MLREDGELHWMLDDILASNNREWTEAIIVTLNAMYRQFELETRPQKTVLPLEQDGLPRRHFGFVYKKYTD